MLDLNDAYAIAKFIKDSEKQTPVKVYVSTTAEIAKSEDFKVFGNNGEYTLIGDYKTIMDAIANKIINESNLDAIESEEGVEVVRRSLNNEDYYFVMNHTSDEKKFRNEILKAYEAKIVKV